MRSWSAAFDRLLTALRGRRRTVLAASLFAFVLMALAGLRIRVDGRVESLLPEHEKFLAEHVEALRRLGAAEAIYVDVAADDADVRDATAADVAARLSASGLFRNVAGPASPEAMARTALTFAASAPLLLRDEDYAEIEARLDPDAVADRIEAGAARLLEPGGEALEPMFRRDPLDLGGLALSAALGGGGPTGGAAAGIPLSSDGKHVLVTATALAPMGDEAAGAAISDALAAAAAAAPATARIDWLGGHRFYRANAATIRNDVALVSVLGLVFVLVVVALSFRGVRATALTALASLAACASGAAAAALVFDSVSGVALAFGGALSGICVDYVLHLRAAPDAGETSAQAVRRTFTAVAPSVAVGAATSATAFLVLVASPVAAHRQIGVVAAAAILGALVFAFVPGPLLAASPNGPVAMRAVRQPMDRLSGAVWRRLAVRPRAALVAGLVLVGASLCLLPRLGFESDLRRFEFKDDATRAAERDFARTWGGVLSPTLLLVRGSNADDALRRTEDLIATPNLGSARWPAASKFLPSERMQAARRDRWVRFWTPERRTATRASLAAAATSLGLRAAAFDPFFASLDAAPVPLTVASWSETALRPLLDRLLVRTEDQVWSVVPAPRDAPELADPATRAAIAASGVSVLGGRTLAVAVAESTQSELVGLALPAALVVVALLWFYYRDPWRAAIAFLPLAGGLAVTGAGLVVAGESLSLMTLPIIVPTLGFSVDYGVFTIDALDEAGDDPAAAARILEHRGGGVLTAALTTSAGGVAMLIGDHPAVRSIGLALALSVMSCFVVAWLVVPGLHGLRRSRS